MRKRKAGMTQATFGRLTGFAPRTVARMIKSGELKTALIGGMLLIATGEDRRILKLLAPVEDDQLTADDTQREDARLGPRAQLVISSDP